MQHIYDAIVIIEQYSNSKTYKDFLQDRLLQDGFIRQIEIIGEATKRISNELKLKNPQIPWKDIAGMRNQLIHNYLGVDIDEVWKTVQKDIPALKKEIKNLLQQNQ